MDVSLMPSVREDCAKRHHSVLMDEMYSFSGKSDHASFASDTTTYLPDAVNPSGHSRYRTRPQPIKTQLLDAVLRSGGTRYYTKPYTLDSTLYTNHFPDSVNRFGSHSRHRTKPLNRAPYTTHFLDARCRAVSQSRSDLGPWKEDNRLPQQATDTQARFIRKIHGSCS